jgi:hypothetical protein
MNYADVKQQLDTAVGAVSGIPALVLENVINRPTSGTSFTRTTLLPARPNRLTVGVSGRDELFGMYQVDLYYPIGQGSTNALTAADLVVNAFPRTWSVAVNSDVLRVTQSWVEAGREVNGWYAVSVILQWSTTR